MPKIRYSYTDNYDNDSSTAFDISSVYREKTDSYFASFPIFEGFNFVYVIIDNQSDDKQSFQSSINGKPSLFVDFSDNIGPVELSGSRNGDVLRGGAGNDLFYGGLGADTINGSSGIDTVVYTGSSVGVAVNLGNNSNAQSGGDAEGDVLTGIENLVGSAFDDTLAGDDNANELTGGAGNDTLKGGGGADTLIGGLGADNMLGGAGDDIYYVDDAGDVATEILPFIGDSGGLDLVYASVSFTLEDGVENLTLTGSANLNATGNALDNLLTGNAGRNILTGGSGNDTLDGGGGVDRLVGGMGDDIYVLNAAGAALVEAANEGIDTVRAVGNYTLGANLENLVLTGTGGNGTGNALANTITGNAGNNALDGKSGADTLIGGLGNDTYYVDNAGDVIVELSGQGSDKVLASVSYTLGENVERLELTSVSNVSGTGNDGINTIIGSTGANTLTGLGGRDTLTGGAGRDTFVFAALSDSTVASTGRDTITDFNQSEIDRIDLRPIDANASLDGNQGFAFIGTSAFNGTAGQLRYEASGANTLVSGDVDGNSVADFAILLTGQIALTSGNFLL